ncbi:MAG TPA: CaiB/BaiF CoA-transferase family protein [Thermoplasmata archaeon]|nr:CaiB/BaiF CoA-transferase family protein [Thermoplasmata archaeon]
MPPALEGITVLDFTRLLPGPFCTQLLCNLGADVIKIEDPKLGDYMRSVPPIVHDVSYPFLMVNRGKRSLAVDLKNPEGQEIVHKLARRADVVVEQFRPGVMARLGAAYDDLAMMNPKLVYCSFSGYGQTGPYKDLPGHDINFQALAGILSVTSGQDDKRPAIPGVPIADMASAFNAALAILAALRTRDRIGRGEWIDVSILDTAVTLMVLGLARFLATGDEPVPGETLLTGVFPFYSLYETKDGRWLSVAAVEPKFWIRMCEFVGAPELSERQFADGAERVAAAQTLAARFRERTSEDWEALFAKEQLPITLVKRVSEVVRDPHVKARELLPLIDVPDVGKLQVIAHPAKHAETKVRDPARVPGKGGNTVEILRSLGYTPRQIQVLAKKEVIGT